MRCSDTALVDLEPTAHHSIRLEVGIDERAEHPGNVHIFGKGFGNHDQDVLMRLHLRPARAGEPRR